jgi:polysaccharide pyruvyl transferase WcaK-like protein
MILNLLTQYSIRPHIALSTTELVDTMTPLSAIISMRYHGTLIATAIGKRVLSINLVSHEHYLNKNKYIYEHYGVKGAYIKDLDIGKFSKLNLKNSS